MAADSEAYRLKAEELREKASDIIRRLHLFDNPANRATMEDIACKYERLATELDQIADIRAKLGR